MFKNYRTAFKLQRLAAAAPPAATADGAPVSQARVFATQHAANAGADMLATIKKIGDRSAMITKIALGVSMPHQIGYILSLAVPYMSFGTVQGWLESVTMILLAVGVPIATDLLILNCIETIGAAAASKGSKTRAYVLIFVPVIASGSVNALAPAPMLIKVLAAFIVTMIPMGEALRFIRPDFAKIEKMETEIASEVSAPIAAPVTAAPAKSDAEVTLAKLTAKAKMTAARAKDGYDQMPQADKANWTWTYNQAQAARATAAAKS